MNKIEKFLFAAGLLVPLAGHVIAFWDPVFFDRVYTREDGEIESLTAAFFLFCAFICFVRAWKLRSLRPRLFLACTILGGFVLFFGAGEEISWGQRIFKIRSPELFEKHNHQGEINLHNLQIGRYKINKIVFSQMLGLGVAFYFFVLPWLYQRKEKVGALFDRLAVPIPRNWQILLFLSSVFITSLIQENRKWEILEFCGGLVFLLIFLRPRNRAIFAVEDQPSAQS